MDEIKKGDKVKLKSGGPVMTVESIDGNNIDCIWFDLTPTGFIFKRQTLDVATLIKSA
jgi:uncharacterized protein YodC (DUF2158 family)